jgi:predicted ATPase
MITSVDLTIKNYRCFEKPVTLTLRQGLVSFIGVNNAGKSSLLRLFYECRHFFNQLASFNNLFLNAANASADSPGINGVGDPKEIFSNFNDRGIELEFRFTYSDNEPDDLRPDAVRISIERSTGSWSTQYFVQRQAVSLNGATMVQDGRHLIANQRQVIAPLEMMDFFNGLRNSLYIGPFRNILNTGTKQDYFDISVGESFIRQWNEYRTGTNKEANRAITELSRQIESIFGFRRLDIVATPNYDTLQLEVDDQPYRLIEMGAGIAQFIIVLANALIKKPAYILIDEPELNLHPALQLDFLTTLASYASEGLLFATHNLGLARAGSEKVYTVRVAANGERDVQPYERTRMLAEFLGELSFGAYQALGFDQLLLVEGTTEVKTVLQFLRMFHKDHQIVILPLGGGSLIHGNVEVELTELKRITTRISALVDSEKRTESAPLGNERRDFKELCGQLEIDCHVLERRAMENYFPSKAISSVLGPKFSALAPFDDRPRNWPKEKNWMIAHRMTIDDLKGTDLGRFMETL